MSTLLLNHSACFSHTVPEGHPECPERLAAVEAALAQPSFAALVRREAPKGRLEDIALCHSDYYVNELQHISPSEGLAFIDGDTSMSPGTWEAALRCVGGATAAVDAVMTT